MTGSITSFQTLGLLLGLQETMLVSTVNNQVQDELKYSWLINWLSLRMRKELDSQE